MADGGKLDETSDSCNATIVLVDEVFLVSGLERTSDPSGETKGAVWAVTIILY